MRLFRKIVDERQELEMMRIERGSCYIMLIGLVIAVQLQIFALDFDFAHVAGEFIILTIGAVWALIGSMRRGVWDYFTNPGIKAYFIYSVSAGFVFGLVAPLTRYFRHRVPFRDCLLFFAVNFGMLFFTIFLALLFFGSIAKRRQEKLQNEFGDEE